MSALPAMEEAKEIISTASTLSLRPDYVMVDSKLADGTVFVPANATAFAGVLVMDVVSYSRATAATPQASLNFCFVCCADDNRAAGRLAHCGCSHRKSPGASTGGGCRSSCCRHNRVALAARPVPLPEAQPRCRFHRHLKR